MIEEINPYQLLVYLQFAIKFANKINTDLPEAKKLCKKLMKVTWDKDAMLVIMEKPF